VFQLALSSRNLEVGQRGVCVKFKLILLIISVLCLLGACATEKEIKAEISDGKKLSHADVEKQFASKKTLLGNDMKSNEQDKNTIYTMSIDPKDRHGFWSGNVADVA
jgi:hypothetical protein